MFKKLGAMLKGLPPELRMLLALAGLGTPIGAFYFIQKVTGLSVTAVIFLTAGLVAGLSLIGWLVSKMFTRGDSKRRANMMQDLTADAAGAPVSMDKREAIKKNNEKFDAAVRNMRQKFNINIFDLPWYIVIGDSGTGKTRLIERSDLTFPDGKPDKCNLGTLDYNFWLCEECVLIDMAGRLCNPQDDADYREWSAFLDKIAKGRRGYPINGAIVCVSAQHLLEDSPSKHEEDAHTLLKRLRDLQSKLGVTFATYVVVTKCDKIYGFMRQFAPAGEDIEVRRQMFGWSKPGKFDELYDPEQFGQDFDQIYSRLNDLRLRRMYDDADEQELGEAFRFPEEFRALRGPLQTYLRVMFPGIKNPRAIKNLILRGVFFTSATQEGSMILKNLKERLGEDAADQYESLETLYPRPKNFFSKDWFFKKVFQEYGLVFRNEQEVARNRKLSKMLWYGSFAAFAMLLGVLIWSSSQFGKLINDPTRHAAEAEKFQNAEKNGKNPLDAVKLVGDLNEDRERLYRGRWAARILSLFIGADEPIKNIDTIKSELFRQVALRRAMTDVEDGLVRGPQREKNRDKLEQARTEFEDGLRAYLRWLGCAKANRTDLAVTKAADLGDADATGVHPGPLGKIAGPESIIPRIYKTEDGKDTTFLGQAAAYLSGGASLDPAAVLKQNTQDAKFEWTRSKVPPHQTVEDAVNHLIAYYSNYIKLDESWNATIQEWMRIRRKCMEVDERYGALLADQKAAGVRTSAELGAYADKLDKQCKELGDAIDMCRWGKATPAGMAPPEMISLARAILKVRDNWVALQKSLDGAYRSAGGVFPDTDPVKVAINLLGENQKLDQLLWTELVKNKLVEGKMPPGVFSTEDFVKDKEVTTEFSHIIEWRETAAKERIVDLTADVGKVRRELAGLVAKLQAYKDAKAQQTATLDGWQNWLDNFKSEPSTRPADLASLSKKWRPADLTDLVTTGAAWIRQATLGRGLTTLNERLAALGTPESWGLAAMLASESSGGRPSIFRMDVPVRATERVRTTVTPEVKPKRSQRLSSVTGSTPQQPVLRPTTPTSTEIPKWATADVLQGLVVDDYNLGLALDQFVDDDFLPGEKGLAQTCQQSLKAARSAYFNRYFSTWRSTYNEQALLGAKLDPIMKATSWNDLQTRLRAADLVQLKQRINAMIAETLENVAFVDRGWQAPLMERSGVDLRDIRKNNWRELEFDSELGGYQVADQRYAGTPWLELGNYAEIDWNKFIDDLSRDRRLAKPFDRNTEKVSPIDWNGYPIREVAIRPLVHMELIKEMVRARDHAKVLLDDEIMARLRERRTTVVGQTEFLPYNKNPATERDVVETVNDVNFRSFLTEMAEAKRIFELIDKDLATTSWRLRYYDECDKWRSFLRETDRDSSQGLSVQFMVLATDVNSFKWKGTRPVRNTANDFDKISLDIGLAKDKLGATDKLIMPTSGGKSQDRLWSWPTKPDPAVITMIEGKGNSLLGKNNPDTPAKGAGNLGPLWLFGFLETWGVPVDRERRTWRVGTAFEVDLGNGRSDVMGTILECTLRQGVPEKIEAIPAARGR